MGGRKVHVIAVAFFLTMLPSVCFADAIIPLIMLEAPSMIVLIVPVILIEALIFIKGLPAPSNGKGILRSIAKANILSTLAGIPFAFVVGLALGLSISGGQSPTIALEAFVSGGALFITENTPARFIPVAVLGSLVPAFFLSVYLEFKILRKSFADRDETLIRRLTFQANAASYAFLAIIALIFLVLNFPHATNYREGFQHGSTK